MYDYDLVTSGITTAYQIYLLKIPDVDKKICHSYRDGNKVGHCIANCAVKYGLDPPWIENVLKAGCSFLV